MPTKEKMEDKEDPKEDPKEAFCYEEKGYKVDEEMTMTEVNAEAEAG